MEESEIKIVEVAPDGWLSTAFAGRKLKMHGNRVLELARNGELRCVKLKRNGAYFFDPVALDELSGDDEEKDPGGLLHATQKIISSQMNHLENVLKMSSSTAESLLKLQNEVLGDLRKRNIDLEEKLIAQKTLVAEADSLDFERTMVALEHESSQQKTDAFLHLLKTYAPAILAVIAKKAGGPGAEASALEPAVKEIVSSLTEDQLVRIWQTGILTKEQMGALALLRKAATPNVQTPALAAPESTVASS